jgi:hypothetical protein
MTASTTEAIFNPPHPGIVRFMQGEEDFGSEVLQCGMSILVCPLSVIHSCEARQNLTIWVRTIGGHLCEEGSYQDSVLLVH